VQFTKRVKTDLIPFGEPPFSQPFTSLKAHPEPSGAQRTHELLLQHADACRRYADGSRGHTAADTWWPFLGT